MTNSTKEDNVRRLLFSLWDDSYFVTYNTLLFLSEIETKNPGKELCDHRKLSFIIDFIANEKLMDVLFRNKGRGEIAAHSDRQLLHSTYLNGVYRTPLIEKNLLVLETQGFIDTKRSNDGMTVILKTAESTDAFKEFVTADIFAKERNAIQQVFKFYSRIRTVKVDTFIQRFFGDYGVQTWGV